MVERHLREQIQLLQEHVTETCPDARFIEVHAQAIVDLARELANQEPNALYRRDPFRISTLSFQA